MRPDTGVPFPATRVSVVQGASSDDVALRERAVGEIASVYWAPVYTYVRLQWRLEVDDACDATQEFFERALRRDLFAKYDPSKARFRTYVRLCLDSFMANEARAERRDKRGGGLVHLPIDDVEQLVGLYSGERAPDDEALFDREWLRALIATALEALRAQCLGSGKDVQFAMMHLYDVECADAETKPTYGDLAQRFDVPVTQVTNYLAWARRQLREHVLATLRAHSGNDREFREDARHYFGVDVL
jgi:DNA-directed RNA polymerase specialized sigma24 family protein